MDPIENTGYDLVEDEEQSSWIVTYADLMTLLLVFFVLMYAISSLNLSKFKRVMSSIQITLSEEQPAVGLLDLVETPVQLDRRMSLAELSGMTSRENAIMNDLDSIIEERSLGEHIITKRIQDKIYIQIRGKVLFASGSAELNEDAIPILDKIAGIIESYKEYKVNIKGHTDNTPISTVQFASNWELSAIRATSVLKHLIHKGINPARLTATGYGEIIPLVPNSTEDNKAMNRRVEFVLEK